MNPRATVSSSLFVCLKPFNLTLVLLALLSGAVCKDAPARDDTTPRPAPPKAAARLPEASPRASNPLTLSAANQMLQGQGLLFIENRGQFDSRVKFLVKGNGANLWLTNDGIVFDFQRPAAKQGSATTAKNAGAVTTHSQSSQHFDPRMKSDPPPMERLVFKQKLVGPNPNPTIEARDPQPGIYNYFPTSDPDTWRTHVLAYKEVVYRDIWKGIDLKLFANGPNLEEEFVVHPGADASAVRLAYEGVQGLTVGDDGSLKVATALGDIVETSPRIYQEIAGNSVPLGGSFKIGVQNSYTFEVAKRDEQADLIIDPTVIYSKPSHGKKAAQGSLLYSSFLGGSQYDIGLAIAVDNAGNAYVTGQTSSTDFPTTPGAFQGSGSGVFVTKVNALGSAPLVYSTYLGQGARAWGLAVDSSGAAYVAGGSANSGFPITPSAFQSCSGSAFLTKLTPGGDALTYSTCFGYGTIAYADAVDTSGKVYLTGSSGTLPTTPGAFQSSLKGDASSAFLTVIDTSAAGSASLIYSSYFGGTPNDVLYGDQGVGIAVDAYGKPYLTGYTTSFDFPISLGAFMTTYPGAGCLSGCLNLGLLPSAFVAKFDPLAFGSASLIYSTFLGGSAGTVGNGLAVDSLGNTYVTGTTGDYYGNPNANNPFPTTQGAYQTVPDSNDAFVTKLNAAGNGLIYSTLLGGPSPGDNEQWANGIGLDVSGNAYVTGPTTSGLFPTTPDAFQVTDPNSGFGASFVTKLNSTGTGLLYSSYLGAVHGGAGTYGMAVDQVGDAYVTGYTQAIDFPITHYSFQPGYAGNGDAFVTKFPIGATTGISIAAILRNTGGNAGQITGQIYGTGFHDGATAQLNCGGTPVVGQNVTVTAAGQLLEATFDLTSSSPGTCDVVVTNPDQTSASLLHGFTVLQGGGPNLWTTVAGHILGVGLEAPPSPFLVTVGNSGNDDAIGTVVSLYGIPSDGTFEPLFTIAPTPPLPGQPPVDFTGAAFAPIVGQEQIATLIIPRIPAGGVTELPFILKLSNAPPPPPLLPPPPPSANPLPPPQGGLAVDITSVVTSLDTFFGNVSSDCGKTGSQLGSLDCLGNVLAGLINEVGCLQCLQPILVPQAELLLSIASGKNLMTSYLPQNFNDWGAEIAMSCVSCVSWLGGAPAWVNWMETFVSTMMSDCLGTANEGEGQFPVALDPNDKDGPQGWNAPNWVQGSQSLSYSVYALNEPGAGAAAQQVVISDVIDPGLDSFSIQLSGVTIGTLLVPLPPTFNPRAGQYQANTLIDYRPAESLVVYVTVTLNPATNTLTWQFASIDPTTDLPPTNPLVGVLPPGVQGSVLYSATPKQSSGTGTQISNLAGVSFNGGTAQNTPTWSNTLDNTPPTSHVTALPGTELCTNFTVQWSGTDVGAGVGNYTIYVSDNGGSFTVWQTNTTSTSAVFNGQVGHSYGFYSIAQDLVGNIEPGKSSAEATTRVNKGTICGPIGPPTPLGGR